MKEFRFTTEEIDGLKSALMKYDTTRVSKFIFLLHGLCRQRLYLKEMADMVEHRKKIKQIRRHIETVLADLRLVTSKGFRLIPQIHFDSMDGRDALDRYDMGFMASEKAIEAHNSLIDMLEMISQAEVVLDAARVGKASHQNDALGFIREIAELFDKHIAMPSPDENGSFYQVIKIVLGHFSMLSDDPRRRIEAALRVTSSR